jgi:hypothetical protein
LDDAFKRAVDDDEVKCIWYSNRTPNTLPLATMVGRQGAISIRLRAPPDVVRSCQQGRSRNPIREQEVYLGMCEAVAEHSQADICTKFTALYHMTVLAWVCDLIIASG